MADAAHRRIDRVRELEHSSWRGLARAELKIGNQRCRFGLEHLQDVGKARELLARHQIFRASKDRGFELERGLHELKRDRCVRDELQLHEGQNFSWREGAVRAGVALEKVKEGNR